MTDKSINKIPEAAEGQDVKREQILAGAEKLFSKFGFLKTTMEEIAEAAGLKKPSIYYYYENKDSIFRDVMMRQIDIFIDEARKYFTAEKDPVARITGFCNFRIDYFKRYINLNNLSFQIIREAAPLLKKLQSDFLLKEKVLLKEYIDEAIKQKIFKKCDSDKISTLILDISDAMKFKEFRKAEIPITEEVDYNKMKKDICSILELILDGLRYN